MKLGKLLSVGEVVEHSAPESAMAAEHPVPAADPAVGPAAEREPSPAPVVSAER
ncbi:hypothetical protein [Amycolatopsis alkalitolerans]|uniref:hypothetical protein n=1 Tax=Amycolatopsis alkalitolerans TaxID=2547244 RepID=UPI001359B51D|nr:hypothetical protein [Amycolatopsis alkalitolerans]